MKIIHILHHSLSPFEIDTDPRFYEGDWHVRVAKRLIKHTDKFEIECWRPERTFNEKYVRKGNDDITYRIFPSNYFSFRFEFSIPMLKELKELIGKEKILLHIHGLCNFNTYSILKIVGDKIPVVVQSHGGGAPSLLAFRKSSHPLRFIHLLEYQFQRSFKNVDQFFCLNEDERSELDRLYNANAIVQPMGIDFNKFKPIKRNMALEKTDLENKDYILYVGRLSNLKGLDYLFEGFKKFIAKSEYLEKDKIKLLLIGDGPYKNSLISLGKELGILDQIDLLGYVDNDNLPYYYNIAKATVFPSLGESFGMVPIESLACETPVISTNVGAINDVARNFKGGTNIIPLNNSRAIYEAIDNLSRGKFNKSGINRDNAKKYYNWDNIIENTIKVYDELLFKYY